MIPQGLAAWDLICFVAEVTALLLAGAMICFVLACFLGEKK
jgi:hypothetical protein